MQSLRLTASVRSVVTGRAGEQTLHVFVVDQRSRPVQDAVVAAAVIRTLGRSAGSRSQPSSARRPAGVMEYK